MYDDLVAYITVFLLQENIFKGSTIKKKNNGNITK